MLSGLQLCRDVDGAALHVRMHVIVCAFLFVQVSKHQTVQQLGVLHEVEPGPQGDRAELVDHGAL